jgi:hypothetical protein
MRVTGPFHPANPIQTCLLRLGAIPFQLSSPQAPVHVETHLTKSISSVSLTRLERGERKSSEARPNSNRYQVEKIFTWVCDMHMRFCAKHKS